MAIVPNHLHHSTHRFPSPVSSRTFTRLLIRLVLAIAVAGGLWWFMAQGGLPESAEFEPAEDVNAAAAASTVPESAPVAAATLSTSDASSDAESGSSGAANATAPSEDDAAADGNAMAGAVAPIADETSIAVVGLAGAKLADLPSGAEVAVLGAGSVLTVHGRTEAGDWLLVETRDGAAGWVETEALFTVDVSALPVSATEQAQVTVVGADGPRQLVLDSADGEYRMVAVATTASENEAAVQENSVGPTQSTGAAPGEETTASESAQVIATVTLTNSRLNVRSGPGGDYAIIAKAYPGESYTALGRNEDGDWIRLAVPAVSAGFGWVAADYVTVDQAVNDLPLSTLTSDAPVYDAESLPQATAASQSAAASTGTSGLTGTLVFQANQGGTIYAYVLETGALTALTTGFDPALSPDGTTVAFTREGGENGLYLIDIDGGNERLVFSGRTRLSAPSWSPDGTEILFTRGDEYVECYDMGRMGCLSKADFEARFPAGTEDEFPLVKQYDYHLAAVDLNGENYRDLPALPSARAADWTAAGIVYQSSDGLQITSDDQAEDNRLLAFDYLKPFYRDPDWQQNGDLIAFQSMEGSHWEIYTISADGSGMTALTRPVTTLVDELPSNVSPTWSPDGAHIVFLSNRADDNSTGPWRLWIMNADGTEQRALAVGVEFNYTFGAEQMVDWGVTGD